MARTQRLVNSGMWKGTAQAIAEPASVGTALTSAGTGQGDAYAIVNEVNIFGTVGASSGAVLPTAFEVGDRWLVVNGGANALAIYPPSGGYINNASQNAAYSLATAKAAEITAVSTSRFIVVAA